ncbi:bridging integrator 3 isoform 2-T3 [Lycaon pictus]
MERNPGCFPPPQQPTTCQEAAGAPRGLGLICLAHAKSPTPRTVRHSVGAQAGPQLRERPASNGAVSGRFGSVFPSLNMAVKRREQALQDYRRLQAKVEKYEEKEKTGPVLAKLHQAREELRPVREDFEAKNKQLLDEMPRFYNSRLDYFQPSFESLIRAQVGYYSEMQKIFGDLTQQLDQPGHPDELRERENEARLSELRALSIVADD